MLRIGFVAVLLALGGALLGPPALTSSPANISADPATPGAAANHTVTVTVVNESPGTLYGIEVVHTAPSASITAVDAENVLTVGVDRRGDDPGASVDVNLTGAIEEVDFTADARGVLVRFQNGTELSTGDEVVLRYSNGTNPSQAGTYAVCLDLHPIDLYDRPGGEHTVGLAVGGGGPTVVFTDQRVPSGEAINVRSAYLPDGGYLVVFPVNSDEKLPALANQTLTNATRAGLANLTLAPGAHADLGVEESIFVEEHEYAAIALRNDSTPYLRNGSLVAVRAHLVFPDVYVGTTTTTTTTTTTATTTTSVTTGSTTATSTPLTTVPTTTTPPATLSTTGGQSGVGLAVAAVAVTAALVIAARR